MHEQEWRESVQKDKTVTHLSLGLKHGFEDDFTILISTEGRGACCWKTYTKLLDNKYIKSCQSLIQGKYVFLTILLIKSGFYFRVTRKIKIATLSHKKFHCSFDLEVNYLRMSDCSERPARKSTSGPFKFYPPGRVNGP